jgi:RNA polymerase primary sigma factor
LRIKNINSQIIKAHMRQLNKANKVDKDKELSLNNYIKEVEKFIDISLEEESELIKKIKAGDQEAFEKLVKANLSLVISIAKQYQDKDLIDYDLINEGNLGLINAAQTYDEKENTEFKSYAVVVINNFIEQAIAEESSIVRLPRNEILGSMGKICKPYYLFNETSNDSPEFTEKTD